MATKKINGVYHVSNTQTGGSGDDPNAVKYVEQELTEAQQTQARTNIGALGEADILDPLMTYTHEGDIDPLVDPSAYATEEELNQLSQKVDDISTGKYYGYYAAAADLPETGVDGFAYVGSGPTYTIYNRRNGVWASSGVTVNQSPIGNEEDIDQNASGKLQFADRIYNAQQPNGMGYVILRKNKTFAEQVTEANTIYEIRYNFDLNNTTVTIPTGCVLKFVGGRLSNGTLTGSYTMITAPLFPVFSSISFAGTFDINKIYPVWFVGNDNDRVQSAITLSSLTDGGEVVINAQFTITRTITGANRVVFTGVGNLKINADVDGLLVTQDNSYIRNGRIWVGYYGYSKSAIKFSSPLSNVSITDIEIAGYESSNPSGTGIKIGTTGGRQYGHKITNVKIRNFAVGIDIDSTGNWANNFRISASVEYNNVSVYIHGTNESSRHYINLTGQAPLNVANGVIGRDTTTINGSLWIINVFDVGRTSYIDKLLDIYAGNVICPIEQLLYCRQNGTWNHFLQLPYSGADSCLNNCDGANWVTRSLIGTGSDLLTNPLFQYGQVTYPASDALGYCNADGDGVKVEIAFPEAIDLEQIILMAKTNNAPQKVIIEATGAATESVEIVGNRIMDGRVFRASELFTWRGRDNCTKLVFNILGTPNGNYPGYCRMRYIGVVDKRFHKFTV